MLQEKRLLDEYLTKIISNRDFEKVIPEVIEYAYANHNLSKEKLSDYLMGRKALNDLDEITEFFLVEGIINSEQFNATQKKKLSSYIKRFYTDIEIKKYSKLKYTPPKSLKNGFKILCLQVASDQWLGTTDTNFFMELRKAQLIRYNENAQRIMKRKIRGGKEEWAISINKKAVEEIVDRYQRGDYIPNVWTLNIPDDVETSYRYNPETCELIFDKVTCLDITDGYHRYLGACRCYDEDNDFNTPVELRITRFSIEKAHSFIDQEDKKTPMRKVEARSLDMSLPCNIITDRLNDKRNTAYKGLIKRSNGIINYVVLSQSIHWYYLDDPKSNNIAEPVNELSFYFNFITEENPDIIKEPWTPEYIMALILFAKHCKFDDLTDNQLSKLSSSIVELSKDIKGVKSRLSRKMSRDELASFDNKITELLGS